MLARLAAGLATLAACPAAAAAHLPATVFAAASLKSALDEVLAGQPDWRAAYAGSSVLARQILQGAPADVFISANALWMDELARAGALEPGTRRDLLSNRLALIAAPGVDAPAPAPGADLAAALGDGRLAMALVDAVPAGIYGKAALTSLGVWDAVAPRVAQADNVRAALRLVASGAAPLGIVYATDAAAEPRVRLIGLFPQNSHPPIRYPVALLRDHGEGGRALYDRIVGAQARAIFAAHGFLAPLPE
jgi:molybdate transport system substrate-binding protein